MTWVAEVLAFWFDELTRKQWFNGGEAVDRAIRERFLPAHAAARAAAKTDLVRDADTALAALIVLDQFSRNMFRGQPGAFACDAKALGLAEAAIARGLDQAVAVERRIFFYLPLEHAEDAARQRRSVELVSALGDADYTKYAQAHEAVVVRFGRFPHRNAILGRPSTPEEVEFLKQPGSAF